MFWTSEVTGFTPVWSCTTYGRHLILLIAIELLTRSWFHCCGRKERANSEVPGRSDACDFFTRRSGGDRWAPAAPIRHRRQEEAPSRKATRRLGSVRNEYFDFAFCFYVFLCYEWNYAFSSFLFGGSNLLGRIGSEYSVVASAFDSLSES